MLPYKLENGPVLNVFAVHKAILQQPCLRQYQWYPAWQWIVPSANGSLSKICRTNVYILRNRFTDRLNRRYPLTERIPVFKFRLVF